MSTEASYVEELVDKSKDFAGTHFYLKFKAISLRQRIEGMVATAEKLEKTADEVEKMGDEKTRKKFKRAERIAAQYAELKAELEEAGIDVGALDAE